MKEFLLNYIKGDKYLWAFIAILALFSFLPVYSASSNLVFVVGKGTILSHLGKHTFFLIIGIGIIIMLQNINYKYYGGLALLALPIIIVLLMITLAQGTKVGGVDAQRWLRLPGIPLQIQTSTLASLTLLIYIARYLTKMRNQNITLKNSAFPLLLPIFFTIGLIFPANGSTSVIIFALSLMLLFLGNYPIKYLIGFLVLVASAATIFILVVFNSPELSKGSRIYTWKSRIENFTANKTIKQESYQVKHAKAAIVQGGQFGKGPGKSAVKQTLPQSSSDFIFAIIIEEYGAVGGITLIFIYVLILFRIIVIATKIHTFFGTLLVLAVGIPIILQAFINMGVAVNLFPVTGQPLPMISMGGTSLWITCAAFGIILSVSRQIKNPDEIETEKKKNSESVIEDIA